MNESRIDRIIDLLTDAYGFREWRPDGEPLAMLVKTILSQNTSDTNSLRAYDSLIAAFPDWESLAGAYAGDIADAIRGGGLADIKAARIRQVLAQIKQERGSYELDFLAELPAAEANAWLKQLPGVGAKTASCVLLFSLGKPVMPVDTHVFRVSKRLGFVSAKESVERAHEILESLVPRERTYQFHILVIEHGRRVCKAQRPRCAECVLCTLCPSCTYEGGEGEK